MSSTRQLIVEYLENNRIASARDIGRTLRMTAANVRHHLSILSADGVVEVVGQRQQKHRGRPTLLYSLTSHTAQHNLDRLADALLQEMMMEQPTDRQLARLVRRLVRSQDDSTNLAQRLNHAVMQLNGMNYNAHWEAHADAPHLILGHCPYAKILPEHPELCRLDSLMIGTMLDATATHVDKLAKDNRGATFCRFIINQP